MRSRLAVLSVVLLLAALTTTAHATCGCIPSNTTSLWSDISFRAEYCNGIVCLNAGYYTVSDPGSFDREMYVSGAGSDLTTIDGLSSASMILSSVGVAEWTGVRFTNCDISGAFVTASSGGNITFTDVVFDAMTAGSATSRIIDISGCSLTLVNTRFYNISFAAAIAVELQSGEFAYAGGEVIGSNYAEFLQVSGRASVSDVTFAGVVHNSYLMDVDAGMLTLTGCDFSLNNGGESLVYIRNGAGGHLHLRDCDFDRNLASDDPMVWVSGGNTAALDGVSHFQTSGSNYFLYSGNADVTGVDLDLDGASVHVTTGRVTLTRSRIRNDNGQGSRLDGGTLVLVQSSVEQCGPILVENIGNLTLIDSFVASLPYARLSCEESSHVHVRNSVVCGDGANLAIAFACTEDIRMYGNTLTATEYFNVTDTCSELCASTTTTTGTPTTTDTPTAGVDPTTQPPTNNLPPFVIPLAAAVGALCLCGALAAVTVLIVLPKRRRQQQNTVFDSGIHERGSNMKLYFGEDDRDKPAKDNTPPTHVSELENANTVRSVAGTTEAPSNTDGETTLLAAGGGEVDVTVLAGERDSTYRRPSNSSASAADAATARSVNGTVIDGKHAHRVTLAAVDPETHTTILPAAALLSGGGGGGGADLDEARLGSEIAITIDDSITVMDMSDPTVELVGKLGEGAFGDVYHYMWNYVDVAVKVVKSVGKESVQEFIEEAQTLAQLRCAYCVSYAGISLEPLAIVTEYMEGGDVASFLKQPADVCTEERRRGIVLNVAKGLAFLHSNGIAHRDLKPANILLSKHFEAKLADFGLSGDKELNLAGAGTLLYCAPEVLGGAVADQASDVYSFGCVIVEVLGGQRPFGNHAAARRTDPDLPPANLDTLQLSSDGEGDGLLVELLGSMFVVRPSGRAGIVTALGVLKELF